MESPSKVPEMLIVLAWLDVARRGSTWLDVARRGSTWLDVAKLTKTTRAINVGTTERIRQDLLNCNAQDAVARMTLSLICNGTNKAT
jgi:hypothetical protein